MADASKGPDWNPFVVFAVLIGILLLFFIYLSLPPFAGCYDWQGYETGCR